MDNLHYDDAFGGRHWGAAALPWVRNMVEWATTEALINAIPFTTLY
jgi:hypothetical protein